MNYINLDKTSTETLKEVFIFIENIPNIDAEKREEILKESVETSLIINNMLGLRIESILASILSRYVFDKYISIEEVEQKYGKGVSNLISSLNQIIGIGKKKMEMHTENFIQLILTIADDPRTVLILLAIQLNKIRNFKNLAENSKEQVLRETKLLYAPIAHRLGLYAIKTELEDTWMKYAENTKYKEIANLLSAKKTEREEFIRHFINPLKGIMKKENIRCEIKGRPKSIYSIWNKMKKQGVGVEDVYDKFAIRIIIDEPDLSQEKIACWKAYSLVTEKYRPFPNRLRDWISSPKSSGYESLHTTVEDDQNRWVEVQIRTVRMDDIAENGLAAHWKYKESSTGTDTQTWLQKMRNALQKTDEPKEKADDIKKSLYKTDIFVFTPGEDLKKLRANSTVLDFAFSIHTQVGLTCKGARVNDRFVSIKQVLKNGDKVEIETSKSQKPNEEWLNYVHSQSAKSKIKRAIKEQKYQNADLGRDILKRKFNQLDLPFSTEKVNVLLEYFKLKEPVELYENIALQKYDLVKIKQILQKPEEKIERKEKVIEVKETQRSNDSILVIEDLYGKVDFTMAKCCNPIPGDTIFGFITVSNGTKIHKTSCPNAAEMMAKNPYRIVKTEWSLKKGVNSTVSKIQVVGLEDKNILSSIATAIENEAGIELKSMNLSTIQNKFNAEVLIETDNIETIEELLKKLNYLKGIEKAFKIY